MKVQKIPTMLSAAVFSCLIICMSALQAQPAVKISEDTISMSKGDKNGFTMTIADVEPEFVESLMKKYFKPYKGKIKGNYKEEIFIDDMTVREISDNTLDYYLRLNQLGTNTEVRIWVDMGGIFLNSRTHADETAFANDIMQNFSWKVTKAAIETELIAAEKELDARTKELEAFEKEKSKLQSEIEKNKNTIVELNADVANNKSAQDNKREQIIQQKDVIADLSGDLREEAEKTLKDLKKEQKKLESDGEKIHKNIEKSESAIKEAEREIDRNEKDQDHKKTEIEDQNSVIKEINGRLDVYRNIK